MLAQRRVAALAQDFAFASLGDLRETIWEHFGLLFSIIFPLIVLIVFSFFFAIGLPFWLRVGSFFSDIWSSGTNFKRKGRFHKNVASSTNVL